MKHIITLIFSLFISHLALIPAHAAGTDTATTQATALQTVTLDVPGMTCSFCPITIRKALSKVDGVIEAEAEYETKTATVTFDPSKTNVDTLIKTTAEAGYISTLRP